MFQRPQNLSFRLADIQMSLHRATHFIQVEILQPITRFLNQIFRRGKKTSVISRPDPTKKIKGKDPKRIKSSTTTMQK